MKTFKANNILAKKLIDNGFIEVTPEYNRIKGKRNFKKSKRSSKEIYFDYINIRIVNNSWMDSRIEITEMELYYIFLYFELSANDMKEFNSHSFFSFEEVEKGLIRIEKELNRLIELNVHRRTQNKLSRILKIFELIKNKKD